LTISTTPAVEVIENVYRKPLANRYLASSLYSYQRTAHYMIENIIEDGLNDFLSTRVQIPKHGNYRSVLSEALHLDL
jgi:hypothetical protein